MSASFRIVHYADVGGFIADGLGFLIQQEVLHTLPIGMCLQLRDRGGAPPAYYAAIKNDADQVRGVAIVFVPFGAFISSLPPGSAPLLVDDILSSGTPLDGVVGETSSAAAVADAVAQATGRATPPPWMSQKVHKLGSLVTPAEPAGRLDAASDDDTDLVEAWCIAFSEEAQLSHPVVEGKRLAARAQYGDIFLWKDEAGEIMTLVGVAGHSPNGCRIGPVYTPPKFRARGHGTAATAALSAHMLKSGRGFCCLLTDAANPTSNRIYAKIGYRVVGESVMRRFAPMRGDVGNT